MSEVPETNPTTTPTTTPAADKIYSPIGLRDVVVAELLTDEPGQAPTYGEVIPLVGAIDFDITDNSGDPDVQDYDDHEGHVVYPDPTMDGTMEMADVLPEKLAMLLGNTVDENGVVIHTGEDKPPYFAWGFKSEKADGNDRYVWYYKGRASMPNDKHTTKPSNGKTPTRQTTKVKVTFVKRASDGAMRAFVDEDSPAFADAKATFFDAPYTPDYGE